MSSATRAARKQVEAIERLVAEQVGAVEHLEAGMLRPMLDVLNEAKRELQRDLRKWLSTVEDPTERFTAHHMRVMLRSIEGAISKLGVRLEDWINHRPLKATKLERAALEGMRAQQHKIGALAVKSLDSEIVRLGHVFGQSLVGPQLDVAAVVARGDRLMMKRFPSSAARYSMHTAEDLRFQIAVGVARGETFEQLVQRLRRIGGPTGPIAVRGIFGAPGAIIEDIPEGLFRRYRHFAERFVRTEMMKAYNTMHDASIKLANDERRPGSPKFERRCDETMDGRTCAFCMSMHGKIMRENEGPPWHPNAVFAGSTFVSYGDLKEIVKARYRGAAIRVTADQHSTTIGPNHPMLTARGMVRSADIREGDYLLYDRRNDLAWNGRHELDLEQVPSIENVAAAFRSVSGYTRIPIAGYDLHGDGIACHGEIEIVRPARQLLLVRNSGGIEKLRELDLVSADSVLQFKSRDGARDLCSDGVYLPSSCIMGGPDSWIAADDHFAWLRVSSISIGEFEGDAFDATTATSLYCSDGFVVSNCRGVTLAWRADWPEL